MNGLFVQDLRVTVEPTVKLVLLVQLDHLVDQVQLVLLDQVVNRDLVELLVRLVRRVSLVKLDQLGHKELLVRMSITASHLCLNNELCHFMPGFNVKVCYFHV